MRRWNDARAGASPPRAVYRDAVRSSKSEVVTCFGLQWICMALLVPLPWSDINDGKVQQDQIARIAEERARVLAKHRLRAGDIIIARRGELNRAVAIASRQGGWVCGTGCFLLRLAGSALDSRFIATAYRHAMVQRQVEGLAVGSSTRI